MQKTFLQIKEADQLVAQLYAKDASLEKSKLGYAWKRFIEKNYKPVVEEINEKLEDSKIENCLVDKNTKEILYGLNGSYKFTQEGLKAVFDFRRSLMKEYDEKQFEVIPFIVKENDLPTLSEEEKELLTGLII